MSDCEHCGHGHPAYSPCVFPPAWEDAYDPLSDTWTEATKFPPSPEGHERILDDTGEDTGYRRELATGAVVFFGDDE